MLLAGALALFESWPRCVRIARGEANADLTREETTWPSGREYYAAQRS
jgi:hypothetical protein